MSTVASRVVRSSPHRNTSDTWIFIVDLLTQGNDGEAKAELMSVSGIVSSIIAEKAPEEAAIVVTCDGPRTRVYCLYDDEAIEGSDTKEDALGYEPLKGNWHISLPCCQDDLDWVQRALRKKSNRITVRDQALKLGEDTEKAQDRTASSAELTLDVERFLKS